MAYPLVANDGKEISPQAEEAYWGLIEAYARGATPASIAKKVYPTDARKRKNLRRRLWWQLSHDPTIQQLIGERAQAQLVMSLPQVVDGLIGRAKRGRPDAAKVILEASGFHNPRVKHEHTGDIKITLDVPRPKHVDSSAEEA